MAQTLPLDRSKGAGGTLNLCAGPPIHSKFIGVTGGNAKVLTKVYFTIWGLVGAAATVFFLTGNMTMLTLVVFGFVAFGLVFMGMMGVLPILVTQPEPRSVELATKAPRKTVTNESAATFGSAVTGWFVPKGIHLRKPKYP